MANTLKMYCVQAHCQKLISACGIAIVSMLHGFSRQCSMNGFLSTGCATCVHLSDFVYIYIVVELVVIGPSDDSGCTVLLNVCQDGVNPTNDMTPAAMMPPMARPRGPPPGFARRPTGPLPFVG